jgi:hypothetical protein
MKALSVRQPWAWAILYAGKNIENRNWPTRFRGRIGIHAPKSIDREAVVLLRLKGYDVPINLPTGVLVGEVTIFDCERYGDRIENDWAEGPYCLWLVDPSPYDEPIPCRGELGLFEVPGELV